LTSIASEKRRAQAISFASILFYITGSFGVIGVFLTLPYTLQNRAFPVYPIIGETWGGGFFDTLGLDSEILLILPFMIVSMLELVVGWWLWNSRRSGARLGLILLPVGIVLSVGLVLPIWMLLHPVKLGLLLLKWKSLR